MSNLSGNKGEWSEVYAFLKLLELGRLYFADEQLQIHHETFFNVLSIFRKEKIGDLDFILNNESPIVKIYNRTTREEILEIDRTEFANFAQILLQEIFKSKSPTFKCDDVAAFLERLNITSLKAQSNDKADINLRLHDKDSGIELVKRFSIKSYIGRPPTLINASGATKVVYRINGSLSDDEISQINQINSKKKFLDRFKRLADLNCKLSFSKIKNAVFENNLLLIDSSLPQIIALVVLYAFSTGEKDIRTIAEALKNDNPLDFPGGTDLPFYEYKIKRFLMESALGMTPGRPWNGNLEANGGYVVVKNNGEIGCYHVLNRNIFENYLFNQTKIESPSSSRHDYGYVYKENGCNYIDLVLQVRFKPLKKCH